MHRQHFGRPSIALSVLVALVPAATAEPPRLSLPIACEVGRTCFVQNHVDLDPGPGVRDFACGAASYDGHKGVDFRLVSAVAVSAGIAVLAAAPGVVRGVRDGMADQFAREEGGRSFAGRECGNGVVVDHGGGWETQYCHMRRGSVAVRSGEAVARGAHLGSVGFSGFADFAHLHFAVRRNGAVIDPYSGDTVGAASCRQDVVAKPRETGLWDDGAVQALPYRRGEFIESGFAAAIPSTLQLEHGGGRVAAPSPESDGLVFFARAINAIKGDSIRIRVKGPGGFGIETTGDALDRDKAVVVQAAGRKRSWRRWAAGTYKGLAELVREGQVVATTSGVLELP